ncbi:TolC family protein [uncultured Duncaniella sp.]|jgi:outer membrane protein|uniref:TolC family protein n=1 Tax=uncultured Duncaniella sp. TaxID=2768039 RepID=UPI0025B0DEB1|nr:TolC family protein [uncultured Duncaniella sp.]
MNILKTTIIAIAAATAFTGHADVWSLDSCVAYAINHNISVQASRLQVMNGELSITEAKDRFLPSLRGSASQSFNFGRGLTADNTYADRNTSNFQWNVSLDLPLFQGLSEYRQLKLAKSDLQRLLYEHEAAKDNVTLNVISQYLQVLYAKEVLESSKSKLELSSFEVSRQKALVEAGKVPEADLLDAEAQMAQDQLQVVTSENDVRIALVELANLLQLPTSVGFDVRPINEGEPIIPTADAVYDAAMVHNNSILASRQGITVADNQISLAKTGYIPTLGFGSSIGSSYYTVNGLKSESFSFQMSHNLSTYVGFSLSIPIFDAFGTRNNVRKAKLQKISAELELDRQSTELYKTIQLAYYQAKGARDRYFSSQETLEKTEASFKATQEKYNLGRATPTEFEQAKNNLYRTEVNSIQAHYEYLLRHRILIFYQNNRL